MKTRETFRPVLMGAGASYKVGGNRIAGFICKTSGTLTVTDDDGSTLIDAVAVTAGDYLPLPIFFNTSQGGTVSLTTAAGTLLV